MKLKISQKFTKNILCSLSILSLFVLPLSGAAGSLTSTKNELDTDYAAAKRKLADAKAKKQNEYNNYCITTNAEVNNDAQKANQLQCSDLKSQMDAIDARIEDLDKQKKTTDESLNACLNKNKAIQAQNKITSRDFVRWDDGECKEVSKSASSDDEDCGNASQFEGGLKGENCRKAVATINDVDARNKSVNETTTMAATAFSQLTAAQATGQQQDAQKSQQKLLQGLALAKVASSASLISGAGQLKSAASGAEEASVKMASAYKAIRTECEAEMAKNPSIDSDEACFYAKAPAHNVPASKLEYTNYDRLKSGAGQSQDQADRANALYKSSTISGLADAFVGYQALQAANQAKQNTGSLASIPPPPTYLLGSSGSSVQPGVSGLTAVTSPTDYTGGDGALLGDVPGGSVQSGLMGGGRNFGSTQFNSAKSTVSGGGGGGGARGGGAPPASNSGKSKSKNGGPSGVGEYNLGGGLLQNPKVDNKSAADANNPFADALAKLFPTDKEGKPVVEGSRDLASAGTGNNGEGEDQNSPDTSIFDQVTTKIRQLSNSGRI